MAKLLPKAWQKQIFLTEKEEERKKVVELYFRLGKFMSSDDNAVMREKIYILPCLCFHFNHSEVSIQFAWINLMFYALWKDWAREDYYRDARLHK